jgi:anthranilate phosphoribosyltransferase
LSWKFRRLERDEMVAAMTYIMSGQAEDNHIGLFLTALAAKGETAQEIAGAATVMRQHMTPIRSRHATCSTPAAPAAAAASASTPVSHATL